MFKRASVALGTNWVIYNPPLHGILSLLLLLWRFVIFFFVKFCLSRLPNTNNDRQFAWLPKIVINVTTKKSLNKTHNKINQLNKLLPNKLANVCSLEKYWHFYQFVVFIFWATRGRKQNETKTNSKTIFWFKFSLRFAFFFQFYLLGC